MSDTMSRRMAMAMAVASLTVASAHAQDGPEHFGGIDGTTTIPAVSFMGLPGPDNQGFSNYAYPGHPGGQRSGQAPLQLPNGSEITQLCFIGNDTAWHGFVQLDLVGWEYPRIGTPTPTAARTLATATSGTPPGAMPGLSTFCAPLTSPIVIKSFGDVDANGVSGWTAYALRGTIVWFPMGGVEPLISAEAFGAAVVVWRRTVSPAPAVATFTDVPTWHQQFRHVEALVASGITGGCAPGRFCPDAGITRGQFAVFLSVALGLHYPN
jgi:hypothetical protein